MKWTKKLPTEPGWYFWRFGDFERVFYVTRKVKNGRLYFGACKGSLTNRMMYCDGVLWAGPIPEQVLPEPEEEQR